MLWLFVWRLSQEAIQRRCQRDRQVKRKFFKLRTYTGDIPCSITLRSAGGVSFQSADPLQQKLGYEIEEYGIKVQEDHSDQQSAADERNEQMAVDT